MSYHFVERNNFEKLIEQGAFLEYAQFGGNYYGTSAKAVEDVSNSGEQGIRKRALLDIDTQVREIGANREKGKNLSLTFLFLSLFYLGFYRESF